jgi:hypothetical protein
MNEPTKVTRMSNAPLEKWPVQMLRGQVALLLPVIVGIRFPDCLDVAQAYTEAEARSFVLANMDLIAERAL